MKRYFYKLIPFLAALMSGVLLAACFPGFEVASSLVWVWSIPLMAALWLVQSKRQKRFAFCLGAIAGLGFWLINIKWLWAMGELPTVPQAGAVFGWALLSVYLALYFGVWSMLLGSVLNPWKKGKKQHHSSIEEKMASKQQKKKGAFLSGVSESFRVVGFAFLHASLWVVLEWLRGWLFTGFGWNGLGVAFHEVPVLMQVADLVGVTGISFFPILLASTVLQTGKRFLTELRTGKFQAHFEIGVTLGIVIAVFAYGVNRMSYYGQQDKRDVHFLLVQENIEQRMKWDDVLEVKNYQGYVDSTIQALKQLEEKNVVAMQDAIESGEEVQLSLNYPDFVMLPESAFTQWVATLESEPGVKLPFLTQDATKRILHNEHFHLLFGANMLELEREDGTNNLVVGEKAYNAFVVAKSAYVNDEAQFSENVIAHGKSHLVPFGEYIPDVYVIQKIMELSSGNEVGMNFSSSGSTEPITVKVRGEEVSLSPTVCFEDTVGRLVRKFTREEQQIIVNITNDGWFGKSEAALQHLANAKFRSVENRRPLVRAANTGVSGVVDILGSMESKDGVSQRVQDASGNTFVKGTLFAHAQVLMTGGWTLYAMAGDWFVVLCALLSVGGIVYLKIWRRSI